MMSHLLWGLLTLAAATNRVETVLQRWAEQTGIRPIAAVAEAIDPEFQKLLEADQDTIDQIQRWLQEAQKAANSTNALRSITLPGRIEERINQMKEKYEDFIRRHPKHVQARLAYGSFLEEVGEPEAALQQWEQAKKLAPNDPVVWNNLGTFYGHHGPIKKALECFEKARKLNPQEPLYARNLGALISVYRRDAREYYKLPDDIAVLAKAVSLYEEALRHATNHFLWATEVAEIYYFLPPHSKDPRVRKMEQDAWKAWQRAWRLAPDELTRQGVDVHLARWAIRLGRFQEAQKILSRITHPQLQPLRQILERRLQEEMNNPSSDRSEKATASPHP